MAQKDKMKTAASSSKKKDTTFKENGGNFKKRNAAAISMDTKKSGMDQKLAQKQRKMQRPHYEMVARAKEIWNIIRERDVEKEKRMKLVDELFELVKGKIYEVAAKHDASRVIQALLKHGRPPHRTQTISELKDHIVELSKMQYGCFLVQKMIKYGSKQDRTLIVKQLTGHIVTIGTHNIAANVLEYAQEYFQPSQLSGLKLEFYGKEFAYFKNENKKNLSDLLASTSPNKRQEILTNLVKILNRMIDKQLLGLAFVQSLMWDYVSNANYEEILNLIPGIRDASLALLATRNGARVVNKCIALGSPKDRKRIVKCLKDKMLEACNHPSGYLVIMRLLDVVDDTVLLQKSVLSELNGSLFEIAMHPTGRKVLLQLLSPLNKKYLSPDDIALLEPPMVPTDGKNSEELIVNYKKDPATRQAELLKGLLPKLEEMCVHHLEELMRSKEGRDVVVEVAKHLTKSQPLKEALINVLTKEAQEEEGKQQETVYIDAIAHLCLRRLIKETTLGESILDDLQIQNQLASWAKSSNRGSFVVLAFIESEHGDTKKALKIVSNALTSCKNELKKKCTEQTGTKLLIEKLA